MKNYCNYHWRGVRAHGVYGHGFAHAPSKKQLTRSLTEQNITVLGVQRCYRLTRLHRHQLLHFYQQLLNLLKTDCTLPNALRNIQQSTTHPKINFITTFILDALQQGQRFSEAIAHCPLTKNPTLVNVLAAGEQSGELISAFAQWLDVQKRTSTLKNKILKALSYPLVVVLVALFISIGLLIFVMPQFAAMYANRDTPLPLLTQWVLYFSDVLQTHGLLIFSLFILIIILLMAVYRYNTHIRKLSDRILLHVPGLRGVWQPLLMMQWSQLLALLLKAGMPLIDALNTTTQTVSNTHFKAQLLTLQQRLLAGTPLPLAMRQMDCIKSHHLALLIQAGSNANLPNALTQIADYENTQLTHTIDYLSKLLEPVIMSLLAVLIGTLIVAMYLPIFQLGTVI